MMRSNVYLHDAILLSLAEANHWSTNRHVPIQAIRRRVRSELSRILSSLPNSSSDGLDKEMSGKLVFKYLKQFRRTGLAVLTKGSWYITKQGVREAARLKRKYL